MLPRLAYPIDEIPIDHVILAIDSLERGVELFRRVSGVTAVYGGAHRGSGTQNALVALGRERYLEILAPNPADTSASARATQAERDSSFRTLRSLTPVGWAIRTRDAAAERERLVSRGLNAGQVRPGSRARPDGTLLRWRTFDPWGADSDLLPFMIEWLTGTRHPSTDAPSGCTLTGLSIASRAPDSLRALFDRADLHVDVSSSGSDHLRFTMQCPAGAVEF